MDLIKYTCHKCQVEFASREAVNEHYAGKWHQYNLMRIQRGLISCSQKEYNEIMAKSTFLQEAKNRVNTIRCTYCKKSFNSQGSYETHQRSRKHKDSIIRKRAETIRRQKIQMKKLALKSIEPATSAAVSVITPEITPIDGELASEDCEYCTPCKAAFEHEKDYKRHIETERHMKSLMAFSLVAERKADLDRQDAEEAATNKIVSADVDADDWEDDSDEEMSVNGEEEKEAKPLKVNVCFFCNKMSRTLEDNRGHMERQHSFFIPHQHACNMEDFFTYLGEKIGMMHECLECSKQFESLRGCRLHMLQKPHLAIRFEGEFDQFFEVEKILARVQLPARVADDDLAFFPMPDGSTLTHRDLRRYFKQRLSIQQTVLNLRRLKGSVHNKPITHLGRASEGKSMMAIRKDNKRVARANAVMHKKQDYKKLDISVKANKLQTHFRLQYLNAG